MVHRLRPGARGLFRQRRHQRVRQFARHHRAEGPDRGAADVARQRGARRPSAADAAGRVAVRGRACRAARARCRPPCWSRPTPRGDYAFLNLKGPAFDLSDRGVAGRPPAGGARCLRLHRARRLSLRRDRAHHRRCCATRRASAAPSVPLTLVVERPDGARISPRRGAPIRASAAIRSSVPISPAASTGTWRVRAFTDPKRPAVGETTFLVEDYVPDRLEFDLAAPAGRDRPRHAGQGHGRRPLSLRRAGLRRSISKARSIVRPPRSGRALPAISSASPTRRSTPSASRSRTCRRPTTRARRASRSRSTRCRQTTRPLEAQVIVRHGGSRRPRGRAQDHAAGRCRRQHDRREAAVLRPLARRGRDRELRRRAGRARRQDARGAAACATNCSRSSRAISSTAATAAGTTSRSRSTRRVADGRLDVAADQPGAHFRAGAMGPLSPRSLERATPTGRSPRSASTPAATPKRRADTPDMLEIALDKPEYRPGEAMTVAVTARTAGRVTLNVMGDKLLHLRHPGRAARHRAASASTSAATGAPAPMWSRPCAVRSTRSAQRMPGRAIGVQWFSIDRKAHTLALDMKLPPLHAAEHDAARADQDRRAWLRRGGARRGRRGRCRHPQPHQLQAAGARRLLSRPAPALRRDPRSLRAADRRHAGHARRRSAPAATSGGRAATAARRRRRRSRSIPASSTVSSTAAPRSRSTFRPSPAPSASWRWPGARTRSAAPTATSSCAIRWC